MKNLFLANCHSVVTCGELASIVLIALKNLLDFS